MWNIVKIHLIIRGQLQHAEFSYDYNLSTSVLSSPCDCAQAVHDKRCIEWVYVHGDYLHCSWASRLAPRARPTWPSTPGWAQSPSHSCPVVAYLSVLWGWSSVYCPILSRACSGISQGTHVTYHVCLEQIPTSHCPLGKKLYLYPSVLVDGFRSA